MTAGMTAEMIARMTERMIAVMTAGTIAGMLADLSIKEMDLETWSARLTMVARAVAVTVAHVTGLPTIRAATVTGISLVAVVAAVAAMRESRVEVNHQAGASSVEVLMAEVIASRMISTAAIAKTGQQTAAATARTRSPPAGSVGSAAKSPNQTIITPATRTAVATTTAGATTTITPLRGVEIGRSRPRSLPRSRPRIAVVATASTTGAPMLGSLRLGGVMTTSTDATAGRAAPSRAMPARHRGPGVEPDGPVSERAARQVCITSCAS
mmetsp:Transcript_8838/g.21848  ORF Transcript_8838/g.21848 Transcript_8838/m.21848 type:complete len:268 (+) Transcript_8838:1-804(+)